MFGTSGVDVALASAGRMWVSFGEDGHWSRPDVECNWWRYDADSADKYAA